MNTETSAPTRRAAYRYLGITDESESCDCCGKNGLKRVVGLEHIDSGEIVRYGTTCAARALGGRYSDRDIKIAAKAAAGTLAQIDYFTTRAAELRALPLKAYADYARQNRGAFPDDVAASMDAKVLELRATLPVIHSA